MTFIFMKSVLFFTTVILSSTLSYSLRAQSPCYEFLCGSEPSELCASDGTSYINGCYYSQAQCKNPSLFVVNPGPCQSKENEMPVDSFESTTETELETEIVEISTTQVNEGVTGTTVDPCKGDTFCQVNKYNPVCGSDGISYSNICQFTKAQCRTPGLEFKHEGRCKNYENCLTRICPMREDSVCANNNKTYRNICELSIAKCYNPSLEPSSNGPCEPENGSSDGMKCDTPCDDQYRPVCATDGKTYPTVCHFQNAKCKNNKLKIYKFEPC